jgi:hypothetical protein
MSSVVIAGNTSGSITLSAPATAGSNTITLPAETGTLVTTATSTGISGSAITTGTVGVSVGGTGANSATAYAVQCGGTTSTGAHQSIASVGTSGQVLTSNGAAALPTFQTISTTPTTAQVLNATAGANASDVGSYALAGALNLSITANSTIAGSSLSYGSVHGDGTSINGSVPQLGATLSGTWKAMGTHSPTTGYNGVTLFLRTA